MQYTDQQIKNYIAYERVRKSGRFNMIMQGGQAAQAAGLDREDYLFVMEHYEALMAAAERQG